MKQTRGHWQLELLPHGLCVTHEVFGDRHRYTLAAWDAEQLEDEVRKWGSARDVEDLVELLHDAGLSEGRVA